MDLELTKIEGDFDEEVFDELFKDCNLLFNDVPYHVAWQKIRLSHYRLSDHNQRGQTGFKSILFEPHKCIYDVTKKELIVFFRADAHISGYGSVLYTIFVFNKHGIPKQVMLEDTDNNSYSEQFEIQLKKMTDKSFIIRLPITGDKKKKAFSGQVGKSFTINTP